jgi:peptide/nickel transport system permease protein
VILRYPVRVALNPFASTLGYLFPYIVSGSIIVSIVLGLPTVGPLLLRALVAQDMFLGGAIVLLLGVMTVTGTLISDFVLVWLDPRIRLERQVPYVAGSPQWAAALADARATDWHRRCQ